MNVVPYGNHGTERVKQIERNCRVVNITMAGTFIESSEGFIIDRLILSIVQISN